MSILKFKWFRALSPSEKIQFMGLMVGFIAPVITIFGALFLFNVEIGKSNKILIVYLVDIDSNKPVDGSLIRLITNEDNLGEAISDFNGRAEIPFEENGEAKIIIHSTEYQLVERSIKLEQQKNSFVICLEQKDVITIK